MSTSLKGQVKEKKPRKPRANNGAKKRAQREETSEDEDNIMNHEEAKGASSIVQAFQAVK